VAKESNVISEQTFTISFQRTDSVPRGSRFAIAQDGQDYSGLPQVFQRPFFPSEQRISRPFLLLADRVPEATEAFQIILSPQGSPAFDNADMLFMQTFVVIEDDDSRSKLNFDIVYLISCCLFML
jgi:hypothetical protein